MDWDPKVILGPRWVSTPNREEDVNRYFVVEGDREPDLEDLSKDDRKKLTLLAERLEFIEHMQVIAKKFRCLRKEKRHVEKLDEHHVKVTVNYEIALWDHDFAGVDFDIEALVLYLMLTCVDTVKGPPKGHVESFKWLARNHADHIAGLQDREAVAEFLASVSAVYSNDYGLSRRFKAAFTSDLNDELQEQLITRFAAVKLAPGEVPQTSRDAWEDRSPEGKIKKMADTLYSMRSTFTHSSIRRFPPIQPVATLEDHTDYVVVQLQPGEALVDVLRRVVVYLTRKLVLGMVEE